MPVSETERPLSPHVTAAALLGVAGVALALVLTVALRPPQRPDNGLLSGLPVIPAVEPAVAATDGGPVIPAAPSNAPAATFVPTAPPPLPPEPSGPPDRPQPSTTPPARQPPPPGIPTTSFEAESGANTLGGRAGIHDVREASGGRTIGWIGRDPANTLRFNGLYAPASGTYTLTVFYISGDGDRTATIRINGRPAGVATFPGTGDWCTVRAVAMRIHPGPGKNSVEFGNPDGAAPDIDRLTFGS